MPVRLLFQDEGRLGRINDQRRCWVPLPLRPRVGQQIVRQYVYNYVAVSPMDGRLSSLTLPYANAEAMSVFLEHVASDFAANWCVMFLDGAGWHIARDLRIPKTIFGSCLYRHTALG